MKNVELMMGLSEIKQKYPIGSEYKDGYGLYKVVGYFNRFPQPHLLLFRASKLQRLNNNRIRRKAG